MIWGLAFVATRVGLDDLSPPQLAAARFIIAAAPVLVLPRPDVPWPALITVGLTLFTGQFLLQFFGIAGGMPPGLAAIVVQTQALFTIVFAALLLRERPASRQLLGLGLGVAGLVTIASTVGTDLSALGLVLTLGSAISWAIGNLLLKRLPVIASLDLVVWLSLVPPIPALIVALAIDGPSGIVDGLTALTWRGLVAVLYLGAIATVLAYAMWGDLLRRYPAAAVTPFALLAPFVAAAASAAAFGERFGPLRLIGMALVLAGLGVIVLPARGRS